MKHSYGARVKKDALLAYLGLSSIVVIILSAIIFLKFNLVFVSFILLLITLGLWIYYHIHKSNLTPVISKNIFFSSKVIYYVSTWVIFEEIFSIGFLWTGLKFANYIVEYAIIFLLALIATVYIDITVDKHILGEEIRIKGIRRGK
ncbi:MAG: hypothetical protein ABGF52_08045 [Candidatus Asgardarchaeum sp.]|nr:hypothetical protein [Candidatus Odinarchaeota archaeon]